MKKNIRIYKKLIPEVIITLIFLVTGLDYAGRTITGDGKGYYEYLPSIFIYHDFVRFNDDETQNEKFLKRTESFGFYGEQDGKYVNRYACGTALLQSPFFFCGWFFTEMQGTFEDGYQRPFHRAIYYAAIFYLFLSLVFLRKLLQLYNIGRASIIFTQILLVFATSVTQYATSNAAFSHIYSLFAISAFLFFVKYFFETYKKSSFLFACLFLGLVIILRQVNGLIIFVVPFLAGSWINFKKAFCLVFKKPGNLLGGLLLCLSIISIQLLTWYLQTGKFIVYSYEGYGFDWLDPEIIKILFSYRKGLFVYTPICLISLVGLVLLAVKKQYFEAFSWLGFFLLLTYVLSSWCFWFYGRSYGLRAYIDFYAVFFILIAFTINQAKRWSKLGLVAIGVFAIILNIIQTYQYKTYILHGAEMNKERYRKIFMKTDERYQGIFFNQPLDEDSYDEIGCLDLDDINLEANKQKEFLRIGETDSIRIQHINVIQLSFKNQFQHEEDSRVAITIDDETGNNKFFHRPHIIHFAQDYFNKEQIGVYNYWIPKIEGVEECSLRLILVAGENGVEMRNVCVKLFSKKTVS